MSALEQFKTAYLIGSYTLSKEKTSCEDHLEELERLCDTYGLCVRDRLVCSLRKRDMATFLGKGKLEELQVMIEQAEAEVIIFDEEISPQQQRNLERFFKRPVIDRTELIIEVFARRAHTREARLQVELAKMQYQMPRLKRLWTHLSRQTSGGGGFTKGEGEKQIELDRRLLRKRIKQLEAEIEVVRAQRKTQRSQRLRSEVPSFAIVGYTNAGKSSLLHLLTNADVLIEDRLFATLDTTARKLNLPNRQSAILIDTVGFIRKLPHQLVAAFRSTLEEVIYTDVLLHLIDVSSPHAEEEAAATYAVLKELGVERYPIITVLNKIDKIEDPLILYKLRILYPKTYAISAVYGTGSQELLEAMTAELASLRRSITLQIPQSCYALVSELMREGHVLNTEYVGDDLLMEVDIPQRLEHKVKPFVRQKIA